MDNITHSGYVAIVGQPNVGKSTLLNRFVGQKLSITSKRPQTTRHSVLGIKTDKHYQIMFVDTPGIHPSTGKVMNRYMNRTAERALSDVDVILLVIDRQHWGEHEEYIFSLLGRQSKPVVLVVNKLDKLADKQVLLPFFEKMSQLPGIAEIVPVSASHGEGVERLEQVIVKYLSAAPAYFPADQISDRSERFFAAEMVREKLTRKLGQEIPYALTVEIEEFKTKSNVLHIGAVVWVARNGQKAIVIGKGGKILKEVGMQARKDMEVFYDRKVFLRLWVKVRKGWVDDERALRQFGYED